MSLLLRRRLVVPSLTIPGPLEHFLGVGLCAASLRYAAISVWFAADEGTAVSLV